MTRRRRHRLAVRLAPADARRRPPPPPGGRGLNGFLRRHRRMFRGMAGSSRPKARATGGPAKLGGRLRNALWPVRLNPRPKSHKAAPDRTPRLPSFRRRRRSVVERVLPTGEPSPPRTMVRMRVMGAIVAALFSLMMVRLWYLQILDTSSYSKSVAGQQVRQIEVPSARGLILDRNGTIMVGNQVSEDLTLSRVSAQEHPAVVGALTALLGIPTAQIEADLNNVQNSLYKPVPIMQNAPLSDVLYIAEHASEFPGVATQADTTRTFSMGTAGAQMIGYLHQPNTARPGYQLGDLVGTTGLEQQYETALRGTPGIDNVEVNAQGNVVGSLGETAPKPGYDLVTNIDAGLEQTLQQSLDAEVSSLHGSSKGGAAVAIDPQTGAVLALVSSPTYDLSLWNNGISQANYNQVYATGALNNNAIDGTYTPGSTFKLASATAALQQGLISPSTTFDDTGTYTIPGCAVGGAGCATYHDNEGEAAGYVNVSQAITVSSDIFFYNVGVNFWDARGKFGQTPIQDTAASYGYGQVTGIDLPGETQYARVDSPTVVAKEHAQYPKAYPNGGWFTGNNLEMAFGQGGTVITPLEQAVAYATFANGGTRYQPEIAAGLVDSRGHVAQSVAPKVLGHVTMSSADYQALLSGFEGVVSNPKGTAYGTFAGFPLSAFPIAGKTGTATTNEQQPTSWFIGWGPLPTAQVLIAVVVEGGGYGSSAAGPVARAGFSYVLNHPEGPTRLAAPAVTNSCPAPAAPTTTTTAVAGASTTTSSTTTTSTLPGTTTTTVPCPPTAGAPGP